MAVTSKDYCNKLREIAAQLGRGEIEEYRIDLTQLSEVMEPDDFEKVRRNVSYTRTIANRVPEVKAVGAIKIRVEEDAFAKYYILTLNRDAKRKVLTNEDVEGIEQKARNKFAKQILGFMPSVMHLEESERISAMKGIELYQDMIRKLAEGE